MDDVDIASPVVGFLNTSFSGPEQGSGHSVPVGYLKGGMIAGKNLVFNVRNIQGTASELMQRQLIFTTDYSAACIL